MVESGYQSSEQIARSPIPVTRHPFPDLRVGLFRFTIAPLEPLAVPAVNKANMLRGGFGHAFRRLCCIPQCRDAKHCPLAASCPYKAIFEPSPPPGADRLSKNQDIPRPFVFRAPLGLAGDVAPAFRPAPIGNGHAAPPGFRPASSGINYAGAKTRYNPGERFEFGLVLIGRALDFLPYFVLSFRELAHEGLGLNRAKCSLEAVEELIPNTCTLGYSSADQLFRQPKTSNLADYVRSRLEEVTGDRSEAIAGERQDHRRGARAVETIGAGTGNGGTAGSERSPEPGHPSPDPQPVAPDTCHLVTLSFLTPTYLRADGEVVRRPEFHHVFKRLRDRINALYTFFGDGPLDVDFRGLGERAEQVRTVSSRIEWVERFRTSSKTHQRHELSGFVGEATYEFPVSNSENSLVGSESGISNLELLKWMLAGELIHVGKHTAWGNGWIQVQRLSDHTWGGPQDNHQQCS